MMDTHKKNARLPMVLKNGQTMIIDTFSVKLRKVCFQWRSIYDKNMRLLGLTQSSGMAIMNLSESDGTMTQKELACLLGVEEPTLARLLDNMENKGLITRRVAAHDRRAKQVAMHPQAGELVEKVHETVRQIRVQALEGIPPQKLAVAYEVLEIISKNLTRAHTIIDKSCAADRMAD